MDASEVTYVKVEIRGSMLIPTHRIREFGAAMSDALVVRAKYDTETKKNIYYVCDELDGNDYEGVQMRLVTQGEVDMLRIMGKALADKS